MYSYLCFDVCAVIAIITLIMALIIRKLTKGRNNVLFLALCVVILISGILDIATELLDSLKQGSEYFLMLRQTLNELYFLVHNFCTPMYFIYICSVMGLWHRLRERMVLFHLLVVPLAFDLIIILTNPVTHFIFYYDKDMVYTHGPLFFALYIVAFYFIVFGISVLIYYRKHLPRHKLHVLITFMPVNALAMLVQMNYHEYRLQVFASTVLAIAVAIAVHRPEETMDYVVGMQSYSAFLSYVKVNFASETPNSYLFIRFNNFRLLRNSLGMDNYSTLLRTISGKFEDISKVLVGGFEIYYLDQGAFAIVSETAKYEQLLDAGRTILAYMQEPVKLRNMEIMLDARICIVRCPEDIGKEETLLNFAANFHNRLPDEKRVISLSQISTTRDFKIRNNIDLIINRGITNRKFEMYYQPIYSIKEGKFTSAEALIRLMDPEYGFISPGIFIPAAEDSGAIHDIGDFVVDDVCRFIGDTDFERLGLKYIEINLSVAQCIEENLFEKVTGIMKKYRVNPNQINLEITETAADYDPEITDKNIERLSETGLTFSLDDYGTGYSNITRVAKLPLSIVKLDKSLVDDMDTPMMWIVIKNTVDMLKRMNKKILVEGIEDKRAYDKFAELGCDYIQGYYFSRPLPEKDFIEFIKKNNGVV